MSKALDGIRVIDMHFTIRQVPPVRRFSLGSGRT